MPRQLGTACDQGIRIERLLDEIHRPELHRLDGERHVAMPGHDDDGNVAPSLAQPRQKLEPVEPSHADIGEDAPPYRRRRRDEKGLGRIEKLDGKPADARRKSSESRIAGSSSIT